MKVKGQNILLRTDQKIILGSNGEYEIYYDGSDFIIKDSEGDILRIASVSAASIEADNRVREYTDTQITSVSAASREQDTRQQEYTNTQIVSVSAASIEQDQRVREYAASLESPSGNIINRATEYTDVEIASVSAASIEQDNRQQEQISASVNKIIEGNSGVVVNDIGQIGTITISADGSTVSQFTSAGQTLNGNVGIGTSTVPHGGIGAAKLAIEGLDSNVDGGPHMQFTTDSDDYPLFQMLSWGHDGIHLNFDAYYDGAWKSSDPGSSFRISKLGDYLQFSYGYAVAGQPVTLNPAFTLSKYGIMTVSNDLLVNGGNIGINTDVDLIGLANDALTVNGSLELSGGTSVNEFSIDGTLAGNSDNAVPTEKAVKTYADSVSAASIEADNRVREYIDASVSGSQVLDSTPVNNSGSGIITQDVVGKTVFFGNLLYRSFTNDKYMTANASAASKMPGTVLTLDTSAASGAKINLLHEGYVRDDTWNWSEGIIYAASANGRLTQTAPGNTGDQIQAVGYAKSADIMYFDPSLVIAEVG